MCYNMRAQIRDMETDNNNNNKNRGWRAVPLSEAPV